MANGRATKGIFVVDVASYLGPGDLFRHSDIFELPVFLYCTGHFFRSHYHLSYIGGLGRWESVRSIYEYAWHLVSAHAAPGIAGIANQSMNATSPLQNTSSGLAATPCRGRSRFRQIIARITIIGAAIIINGSALAQAPKELIDARRRFEALKHPTEADRVRYVTGLVRLRETFTRKQAQMMFAIDAEVRRHPLPAAAANSKALIERLIGRWQSPRRPYFYHADGTWFSDEDAPGNTGGTWRIQGNRFFQNYRTLAPDRGATIILLTDADFVYGDAPFYLRRGTVFPWRD